MANESFGKLKDKTQRKKDMALTREGWIKDAILNTIKADVANIIEAEAEKAAEATRRRMRGSVGSIAARVFDNFDITSHGTELTIKVQIET